MAAPVVKITARAPIDLAQRADFDLGAMHVRPAAREVEVAGATEQLQPRVMQVLVALHDADGGVVSRDDLIARCWAGVVVGDDAVNRVMLKLRRLSKLDGGRSFTLQTVPRVGYRLRIESLPAHDRSSLPAPRSLLDLARRHWLLLSGASLAAAVGATALWLATRTQSYVLGELEMVAQSRLAEMEPTLSPDGRFLVFVRYDADEANSELVLRDLANGEETLLTHTPETEEIPAFSPTGDRLAHLQVTTYFGPRTPCQIMVRVFPQGPDRKVGACEGTGWTHRLSWTADGEALLFSDVIAGEWRIRRLSIQSGRVEDVALPSESGLRDLHPTMSRDGRRLAFVRYRGVQAGDVYVYDLRRERLRRVTNNGRWAQVTWADSRRLFVVSAAGSGSELWLYDATAPAHGERLLAPLARMRRPAAAAGALALEMETELPYILRLTRGESRADGEVRGWFPAFSPDGMLAFLADGWLYTQASGSPPRRLMEVNEHALSVHWSPDGRRIVYTATREDGGRLFVVDLASTITQVILAPADVDPSHAGWSADGRSLVFTGYDALGARAFRIGLNGGVAQPITDYGWAEAIETGFAVFARSTTRPGVWRLARGRAPEQVLPEPNIPAMSFNPGQHETALWTIANGRLYALSRPAAPQRVLSRALEGGPITEVARSDAECIGSLAVSPRTGEVVCGANDYHYDIGLIRFRRG